jgi:acetyl-CoA carboxylase biotin carboxyl carrier protein
MELSLEEIGELLAYIDRLEAAEVEITLGDLHLLVRRTGAPNPAASAAHATERADASETVPVQPLRAPATAPAPVPEPASSAHASTAAASELDAWLEAEKAGEAVVIRSPMVGTFYRSKEPGAPPFVEIGGEVTTDDVVCLVEVMKLFHSVPAGATGVVRAVFVADSDVVEHMQPLMAVAPA